MKLVLQSILKQSNNNTSAFLLGSRRMNRFNYPHSYTGVNASMINIP